MSLTRELTSSSNVWITFCPVVNPWFVISIVLNITDRTVDYVYLLICIFMVITLYYYPMSLPVESSTDPTSD